MKNKFGLGWPQPYFEKNKIGAAFAWLERAAGAASGQLGWPATPSFFWRASFVIPLRWVWTRSILFVRALDLSRRDGPCFQWVSLIYACQTFPETESCTHFEIFIWLKKSFEKRSHPYGIFTSFEFIKNDNSVKWSTNIHEVLVLLLRILESKNNCKNIAKPCFAWTK